MPRTLSVKRPHSLQAGSRCPCAVGLPGWRCRAGWRKHVLTDNGSCFFTQAFARTCAELAAQYRHRRPRRREQEGGETLRWPRSARGAWKSPSIRTINSNSSCMASMLPTTPVDSVCWEAKTPDQIVAERLTAKPALAKNKPVGRAGPCDIAEAGLIAENAKEVSPTGQLGGADCTAAAARAHAPPMGSSGYGGQDNARRPHGQMERVREMVRDLDVMRHPCLESLSPAEAKNCGSAVALR